MCRQNRAWKIRRMQEAPYCHWCRRRVYLVPEGCTTVRDDTATVDHLRSKFDASRQEPLRIPNELRKVLACYRCNQLRAQWEMRQENYLRKKQQAE